MYSTDPQKSYLELRLTAEDEFGLASETVSNDVRPQTVDLHFAPNPLDLKLRANGKAFRGLRTLRTWVSHDLNVGAPRQRDRDGHTWAFRSWSDGAPAAHTVDPPEGPDTYTATFKRARR